MLLKHNRNMNVLIGILIDDNLIVEIVIKMNTLIIKGHRILVSNITNI